MDRDSYTNIVVSNLVVLYKVTDDYNVGGGGGRRSGRKSGHRRRVPEKRNFTDSICRDQEICMCLLINFQENVRPHTTSKAKTIHGVAT